MDVTSAVGLALATAIAIYCLVWLWRLPTAALPTKLFWTFVAILLPGWGTMLFLEIYPPVAASPSSKGGAASRSNEALSTGRLPAGLLAGSLAILGLLYGAIWLAAGVVIALGDRPGWYVHIFGGFTLLALGAWFLRRGSSQLARA